MSFRDLPLESGRFHVKVFQSLGLETRTKQEKLFCLTHPDRPGVLLPIPDHKEVALGTLKAELRKAGINEEDLSSSLLNLLQIGSENPIDASL